MGVCVSQVLPAPAPPCGAVQPLVLAAAAEAARRLQCWALWRELSAACIVPM